MIYYFYLEIIKFISLLFSIDNINYYYKITYFLNSISENLYLNLLLWSWNFPFLGLFYLILDITLFNIKINIVNILNSLIVGFYNIHPILLYLSFFFFISKYQYINIFFIVLKKNQFYVASFTLLLGGYWGAGNSVWGYFWVNDIIEQILLYCVLIFLIKFHIFETKQLNYFNIIIFFSLFFVLFLLRLGFISTRHSFFDTSNIKNILYYFSWLNFSAISTLIKIYIFYYIGWLIFTIGSFFLFFFLIQYLFKNIKTFFVHLLIIILGMLWLKYTSHNISYKILTYIQHSDIIYLQYNLSYLNNILFIQFNYLTIFSTYLNWFFTLKYVNTFLIFFKYASCFFIYFLLLF